VYVGRSSFSGEITFRKKKYHVKDLSRYKNANPIIRGFAFLRACISERPDWIQASDVRELVPALIVKLFTGAKVIYDAHEDYFNQAYEYQGKRYFGLVRGCRHRLTEIGLVRIASSVFCTDDFLYKLYQGRIFGARNVFMQRNFTDPSLVQGFASPPTEHKPLKIVYIGNVNKYRGVIECASHVARYNQASGCTAVTLDCFGPPNSIIEQLVKNGQIRYYPSVPHPDVFGILKTYHIGVCLWLKIKKFERNISIKNFEYMAAGLPVLTSNFGNIAKYVSNAKAGICIDPKNYHDFKKAIDLFRQQKYWKLLAENGIKATRNQYQLMNELLPYLAVFNTQTKGRAAKLLRQ
jgi:glycosyltransferase involved in cell wall biosynthesis